MTCDGLFFTTMFELPPNESSIEYINLLKKRAKSMMAATQTYYPAEAETSSATSFSELLITYCSNGIMWNSKRMFTVQRLSFDLEL